MVRMVLGGEAGVGETDATQNPFYTNCFKSAPMATACFIGNCPCHGGDAVRAASLDDAATAWAVPDFVGSDYLCDAGKGYDMGNAWQCEELFTDPATICDGNRTRDERWWLRRGARPGSFRASAACSELSDATAAGVFGGGRFAHDCEWPHDQPSRRHAALQYRS